MSNYDHIKVAQQFASKVEQHWLTLKLSGYTYSDRDQYAVEFDAYMVAFDDMLGHFVNNFPLVAKDKYDPNWDHHLAECKKFWYHRETNLEWTVTDVFNYIKTRFDIPPTMLECLIVIATLRYFLRFCLMPINTKQLKNWPKFIDQYLYIILSA